MLGNGGGIFAAAIVAAVGWNPESVVAADFNGDGKADLVAANLAGNNASVLVGDTMTDEGCSRFPLSI